MRDQWVLCAEDVPKNYVTFALSFGSSSLTSVVAFVVHASISNYQQSLSEYQGYGLNTLFIPLHLICMRKRDGWQKASASKSSLSRDKSSFDKFVSMKMLGENYFIYLLTFLYLAFCATIP